MSFPTTNIHDGDKYAAREKLYIYDSSASGWSYTTEIVPDHHWRLNESSSATKFSDTGLIARHLTSTGVTFGGTGKIERTASFGSSNADRLETAVSEATGTIYGMTLCAWTKSGAITTNKMVYSRWESSSNRVFFYYPTSTANIQFRYNDIVVSTDNNTPSTLDDDNWHHVVLRYSSDGTNGTVTIFYDGEIIKESTGLADETVEFAENSTPGTAGMHILGNYYNGGSYNYDFGGANGGSIEDFRMYYRPIPDIEIYRIYNHGKGTYSQSIANGFPTARRPVHHWKLNMRSSGTNCSDGGNIPSVLDVNGDVSSTTGHINDTAILIPSGTTNYLKSSHTEAKSYSALTYTSWVNITASEGNKYIHQQTGATNEIITFYLLRVLGTISIARINIGGTEVTTDVNVPDATWTFVCMTYDGSEASFYQNSVFVDSTTSTGLTCDLTTSSDHYVGYGTDESESFDGKLEDVRLYDYVLSQQEIINIYNNGKGTRE